jgi:hypothetical protein
MSQTKLLRILVKTTVFAFLYTSVVSVGLVKAAHSLPHGATNTSPRVSDRSPPVQRDHLALVIANSDYPDADATIADVTTGANALAAVLGNHSFLVIVVRDTTRDRLTEAVDRLKSAARPGSTVLVYFGGFGIQSQGENYMIPVDAKIWQESDVRRDGVPVERMLSDLAASGARVRIAIVDASRRNPYERRFRSYSHGLAPIDADANTVVIASTSPSHVIDDADASPSHVVNDLVAEINRSSRSVEEIVSSRAAPAGSIRRESERPMPTRKSDKNS